MRRIKREYGDSERKTIVNYIIDNEGFYSLRGTAFWKKMEKEKVLDRTWQSMKEHFRMKIIHNLMFYDISKENQRKIIAGFNNTRTVERKNSRITYVPKYSNCIVDFSDEEKGTEKSTSSDDSDNFVTESDTNKASTSKKGSGETLKKKTKMNPFCCTEKATNNKNTSPDKNKSPMKERTHSINYKKFKRKNDFVPLNSTEQSNDVEQNVTIEIDATSSISDVNSDKSPSVTVSSTNIDEACTEFSIADDKKFLQAITKYDSNLLSCTSIVVFIKQYTGYHAICHEWTELYDRFIEILNNLQLYDFLAPDIVTKLQNLREPLEKYRSNGFQEPKIDIFPIKVDNETFKFALVPNPNLIYLEKKSLDFVVCLDKIKTSIFEIFEETSAGNISEETASGIIKSLTEFNEKYVPQRSINNNENCDIADNVEIVKQEIVHDDYPEVRIKEENLSLNIDEHKVVLESSTIKQERNLIEEETQQDISDSISIQPEISLNLSEIQYNSIENSQYLDSLTTEELNATNIVGQMIENDLNQSDLEFLTCESSL